MENAIVFQLRLMMEPRNSTIQFDMLFFNIFPKHSHYAALSRQHKNSFY